MAAEIRGITQINIYAPSGTAKRLEREHFYNSELTYLLRDAPANIFLGGDFNCVLEQRTRLATIPTVGRWPDWYRALG